jgi:hypothetical protein
VSRIDNVAVSNTEFKLPTVSLYDTDAVIKYYFENVIKLQVTEDDKVITVPVMYGSPERWKSVRVDGFMKDNNGKIMVPIVVYKRNNIELRKDLARNLDANSPKLFHHYAANSSRNKYNKRNTPIEKELYNIVIPNYVHISYDVVIWTNYTTQMNTIIENIIYTDNSYWGDPNKLKFHTSIDNIATPVEVNDGEERSVRSSFQIKMDGYIIPDNLQKKMQSYKQIQPTKIIITEKF